jgi:periplasmic protein TonB
MRRTRGGAMFEDALVESTGRIRSQSGWFSGVAALINGSAVSLLLVWPLLHPSSLPRQTLSMMLTAPAPPAAPAQRMPRTTTTPAHAVPAVNPFAAPTRIPERIAERDAPAPAVDTGLAALTQDGGASTLDGLTDSIGTAVAPEVRVARPRPLAISSGVMAGNKISGAAPQYPAIAREARVDGMVVLAATIARNGSIENLHVVSGPPLLTVAAMDAVRTWRYRPYLLNGKPVEVETTVRVVFHLGE